MTLRTKSLLIIGVTLVTLAAVVYALTRDIVVVVVFVLCSFVLGAVALALLERTVLERTRRLNDAVTSIGAVGNLSERVPVEGRDELATLAVSINRTLQRLQRSQGVLRYVTAHARCIIWAATVTRDEDGDLHWDLAVQDEGAAARVLPLDSEGSYSSAWRASVHFDDREACERTVREALESGRTFYRQEYRVRGRDGSDRWVWEEVAVERKADDRWRLVGVCTDSTARKHAEQSMREARDAALEAARLKSAFLANVSHEIRTPLNGLMGLTDLLNDTGLDDEQRDYVDMIKGSAAALLSVMSDVIDYSKIESGHLQLQPMPFDVRRALGDVLAVAAVQAHGKGLELVLDVDPEMPRVLVGDEARLRQIVTSLVGNAIKFTTQGEVVVAAAVRPVDDDDRIELGVTVTDTGIGIAEDDRDVIFSPFQQADPSATRRHGGTGLGLAISRELARHMDGRLEVESEVGAGSTFRLILRVDRDPEPPDEAAPVPRSGRILIVDDNDSAREVIERHVVSWGFEATAVATAADAIAEIDDGTFELVLCDADLDGASGFALVAQLDGAPPAVMLIRADDRHRDVTAAREAGAVAWLTKPVRESELLDAIEAGRLSP